MKYLKTRDKLFDKGEHISFIQKIIYDIDNIILLELKDDNYSVLTSLLYKSKNKIDLVLSITKINTLFKYSDIEEYIEELRSYLLQYDVELGKIGKIQSNVNGTKNSNLKIYISINY